MRVPLTKLFVDSVKPPHQGQFDYWDTHASGFGLRISAAGQKSWVIMYRHNGRLRRMTLGAYPTLGLADGRRLARAALRDAAHGADPAGEKQAQRRAESFRELAELYLEKHAKVLKRSWREDERTINRELLPRWKNWKAAEIKRKHVIAMLDEIAGRGSGIMANRTRALASKIFNFGIQRGVVEYNPVHNVPIPGEERRRDRVLTEEEIRQVWGALDNERLPIAATLKLALLTAQRRSEVLGMRWDELRLDAGWWTIPAERAKNKMSHRVPLAPQALDLLRGLREQSDGSAYVFLGSREEPISNLQKPMRRLRQRTGIEFRFHDLRRTAASHMTGIGISRLVVGKILNHAERDVTAVYDRHSYDTDKEDALRRWDLRLRDILANDQRQRSGRVVELATAKAVS
jgi:integrase